MKKWLNCWCLLMQRSRYFLLVVFLCYDYTFSGLVYTWELAPILLIIPSMGRLVPQSKWPCIRRSDCKTSLWQFLILVGSRCPWVDPVPVVFIVKWLVVFCKPCMEIGIDGYGVPVPPQFNYDECGWYPLPCMSGHAGGSALPYTHRTPQVFWPGRRRTWPGGHHAYPGIPELSHWYMWAWCISVILYIPPLPSVSDGVLLWIPYIVEYLV